MPFYLFSQQELAPDEDQGFFFGFVQASANATLDQTKLFADQIYDVYRSFPESGSIFQITTPSGGFGGMTTKPWSQRTKTTQQLLMESMGPLSKIPGIRVIPQAPPPLPGGGNFPVDLVIASAAEPQQLSELADTLVKKAFASGHVHLRRRRRQVRPAADRDRVRSRQAAVAGRRSEPGRPRSVGAARRQLRQPLQHRRPQLQGDSAGGARRAADRRISCRRSTSPARTNKLVPLSTFASLRTTTEPRELKKFQQLNAVRIQGVIPPPVPLDKALGFLENEAQGDPAAGLHHRLRRRVAPAAHRRQQVPRHVPAVRRC